ncbi:thymidine phosphorylase (modular protein) [uncultured Alphaproteobacteria bacterium]|uniref:Thymidine phosphorylase n=1 Tax=uncultured Alphaproteobacteria bacterium TaxID=91750 RepID=A0A212JAV8_9PROT|nr:thymidine phosphorylase (modular protein) [uncultured Alphaproteobacteria bacterium]
MSLTRKDWARRVLSLIDLTNLDPEADDAAIIALCEKALDAPVPPAGVCVPPRQALVPVVVLRHSGIRPVTVANFPEGRSNASLAAFEVLRAVNDGVEEVDVVFPYADWLKGNHEACAEFVSACKSACGVLAKLKVILETGAFPDPAGIGEAARAAIAAGADFIKTSTGKIAVGATPEAAEAMLAAIRETGGTCGFKVSGGVRSLDQAVAYVRLAERTMGAEWVTPDRFRIGASGLLDELAAILAADDDAVLGEADGPRRALPQETIAKKRDGGQLDDAEIADFVAGLADGSVADAQAAAFAMAVLFRDLSDAECRALTLAMRDSGRVLDWRAMGLGDVPVIDKHSTGGIGDKVSLILAPLVAACGVHVPMISGRGLGHTGGTLDKLSSVPGYDVAPSVETFAAVVRRVGCAVIGQTDDLAPADRRLYAIRDVSATVESLPLIVASILSKKLAAGLDGLVLDVKTGSGAFMVDPADAEALARRLVTVAKQAGLPTRALITDMNQALGSTVGNALEVAEAVAFLRAERRDPRLEEVTLALGVEMLGLVGIDAATASRKLRLALDGGRAAETFARMVAALGGPLDFVDNAGAYLDDAPVVTEVRAETAGFVAAIDAKRLGLALVDLGGGRTRPDRGVDVAVGLSEVLGVGAAADAPLCRIHARDAAAAARAAERVRAAFTISERPVAAPPVLHGRIVA